MTRRFRYARHLLLLALFATGCSSACSSETSDTLSRPTLPPDVAPIEDYVPNDPVSLLPATFRGVLPCADCSGIDYHLNLFGDQTYFLRMVQRDQPLGTSDDIGRWSLSSDRDTLLLTSDLGRTQYFALIGATTLRKLDRNARPIDSLLPLDLTRSREFLTIAVHTTLRGSYVTMMNTGMFTECATQRRWMVAPEGGSRELDAVYREQQPVIGSPLVVSVRGKIANRPADSGNGTVDVLVVDHVLKADPGDRCGSSPVVLPLEGTRWHLTQVGETEVVASPGQTAPPVLTLGVESAEFWGSTGCNRTLGTFRRDGASLQFDPAVTTRLSCPDDRVADEAFVGILEDVARWRVLGRILELSDARGRVLARFEAR